MLSEISARFPNALYDDQRVASLYHLSHPGTTALDREGKIFLTLHGCQVDMDKPTGTAGVDDTDTETDTDVKHCRRWFDVNAKDNVFEAKVTGTRPAVVHGNGPFGKQALALVVGDIDEQLKLRDLDVKEHDTKSEL
jgi:hypothetical protein